jgi:hypothetical protein
MKNNQLVGLLICLVGALFVIAWHQGWVSFGKDSDDFRKVMRGEVPKTHPNLMADFKPGPAFDFKPYNPKFEFGKQPVRPWGPDPVKK